MKIAITGGAGFIGSNLVSYFRKHLPSLELVVVDDLSNGKLENLEGLDVDFREGSILDSELLDRAFKQVSAVVHLAAIGSVPRSVEFPLGSHEANATGTLKVLEAARKSAVNAIVFASSSSVYGSNPAIPKVETAWTRPMSPYAASKLAGESYVLAYGRSFEMQVQVFRFFNVYGPYQRADHQYAAVIPKFISSAIASSSVTVFGDGAQTRDFTYVDSVCEAIAETITAGLSNGSPVNLAFGTRTSLIELIVELENVMGMNLEIIFQDHRTSDVRDSQADPSLFLSQFPTVVSVPLPEGLKRTVAWMTQNYG